ncbi:MAG: ABC transporter ATP-binding protein [Ruminococcaceae bacterium]|nr:ABC transporter ATP-binding protein [Oscillospiraceae bacterium]
MSKSKKAKAKAERGTLRNVLRCLKPYRGLVFLSVLLSATCAALTLYVPILVGRAIDLIVGTGNVDFDAIVPILIRIGIVVLATAAGQWIINAVNNRITCAVVRDVRQQAFERIGILPFDFLDTHPTGELVSRVISDVDQFSNGLLLGFSQLFTGIATIIGTLGFMVAIRPLIALIVVVLTPISFVVAKFIATRTHSMFTAQAQTKAEQTALVDELLTNQKVVKAFTQEQAATEKFDEVNARLEQHALKAVFFSSLTNPCTRCVNGIVYAVVALIGAMTCISTAGAAVPFTVGNLSALLSYANQYTKPFNEISGVITELQNAFACASRVFALINQEPQTPDAPDARVLTDAQGSVAFENVSFSYVPERKLIQDMNLQVQPGQRVAIVGPTGCGKTTLINLLMRFYDVNSGAISVDGTDVRGITRSSLRTSFGMVLQDTWLSSGTVRENIIMGKPDATDEEIIAAAKASHAHGFIRRLPKGYDTVLGADGGGLSQGQKQLLCITRVMLALPPMLILDEATSSIDTRTELKIQNAFGVMMEGRTSFIVAHRLSTIREADVILVMKDGSIIEQGTHDELLAKGGFYATLYNSQFAQG